MRKSYDPCYARVFRQDVPQQQRKDPPVPSPFDHDWTTPVLMLILSVWAGLVSYMRRLVKGAKFSFLSLASHLGSSALAGFIVALLCQQYSMTIEWMGVCCALAGHMSAEAMKLLEDKARSRAGGFDA